MNDKSSGFCERYYLAPTNDQRDRTAEIEEKLRLHGVCLLGGGEYFVSGVEMPPHTTLMGLGTATKLVLCAEVEEGAAVKLNSFCTVKSLSLYGSAEGAAAPKEIGGRHGLLFAGTATTKDWKNQPRNVIVSDCLIRGFSGGGLTCADTGYLILSAITAANCHILDCGVGVYIPHFSEYHEFTNMLCAQNLYGCINNGGNNVFCNCGFNDNETGFLMDNRRGQSPNDSHGSVVGCTFNHNGNNKGIGILALGMQNGYVFTGCQVFYSKIVLENCNAMTFSSFNFGRNTEISVKGGRLTMFSDCAFHGRPTVTVEDNHCVKFIHCYTCDGEEVTAES